MYKTFSSLRFVQESDVTVVHLDSCYCVIDCVENCTNINDNSLCIRIVYYIDCVRTDLQCDIMRCSRTDCIHHIPMHFLNNYQNKENKQNGYSKTGKIVYFGRKKSNK